MTPDAGRRAARDRWTVIEASRPVEPVLPAWARAADLLSIALVIVGVTVSASGGFRLRVGEWRFALTSLGRPLLLAVVVAGVRHLLVRDQPVYAHALQQARRWARSDALRAAAAVLTGSRPIIFFAGLLAVVMFGYPPGAPPWRDYDNELMNLPLRWDAGWYLQIAENGYSYIREAGAEAQQNIVFFPAYPMVTRGVALLLGNQKTAYVAAGTIVSLTAFLFALAYLHAFARDEIGEERAAAALWLLAAYPFALFFGAIYTESLYLLAALGAFHHLRRRELVRAGFWGLVIGLTRPNGGLLSVPLALTALSPWLPHAIAGGRTLIRPPRARSLRHVGLYEYVAQSPYDMLNVLGASFALAAVWPVWRRFGIAFAVFIAINILPPLTTGGFLSAGRFSSVLFPAFVWLAAAVAPRQRTAWIVSFAMLQAMCAALFYTWRPLF
jgi:hypothetical protein